MHRAASEAIEAADVQLRPEGEASLLPPYVAPAAAGATATSSGQGSADMVSRPGATFNMISADA